MLLLYIKFFNTKNREKENTSSNTTISDKTVARQPYSCDKILPLLSDHLINIV